VALTKFLGAHSGHGKLVVFDEAHKYMQPSLKDELTQTVVSTVRQMRHYGVRVVVSTQSPKTLPAELLELVSVAMLLRFSSPDWFEHLSHKLPLPRDCFHKINKLATGEAIVCSLAWATSLMSQPADSNYQHVRTVTVRPRITADSGASKLATSLNSA